MYYHKYASTIAFSPLCWAFECLYCAIYYNHKEIIAKLKEKYPKRKLRAEILEAEKNAIDVGVFDQQTNEYVGKESFMSEEGVDSSLKTGMLLYT